MRKKSPDELHAETEEAFKRWEEARTRAEEAEKEVPKGISPGEALAIAFGGALAGAALGALARATISWIADRHIDAAEADAPYPGDADRITEHATGREPRAVRYPRMRGEDVASGNARVSELYREDALVRKVEEGRWLPKAEYEQLTGRPGAKLRGRAAMVARSLGIEDHED
jgi:hypothetical protein